MSGIAGIIRWDGLAPASDDVARMAGLMSHRGEGPATVASLGGARFAGIYRNLNDRAAQPTTCAHPDVLVAADCRLFNRNELIRQLAPEKAPSDIGDAELLAAIFDPSSPGSLRSQVIWWRT